VPPRLEVVDRRRRRLLALMAAAAVPAGTATAGEAAAVPTAEQARDFRLALDDYEGNRWPEAYAAFALLADQGHAPAAGLALHMLGGGVQRYGLRFEASAAQRLRWSRAVAVSATRG